MCTALHLVSDTHYFGRTLDVTATFGEEVAVMPRRFPLRFRNAGSMSCHFAIIGMAYMQDGFPLYYDAVNERGLCMAGLRFQKNALYMPPKMNKDNIAPFELIPWVLAQCENLAEARGLLSRLNIADISYSETLPHTPLHWLIADRTGAVTVEQTADGLSVYDNPVGVLTNDPPFPLQMENLAAAAKAGLSGGTDSPARFVRAAHLRKESEDDGTPLSALDRFFHILEGVSVIKGCDRREEGLNYTAYTAACDADRGIYYYKTYHNSRITAVDLHREDLDGSAAVSYPLVLSQDILFQN